LTMRSIRRYIDQMVNTGSNEITEASTSAGLRPVSAVVAGYVVLTAATIVTLIILEGTARHLATKDAWGHAVIVLVFAVLLPLRLRAARKGSADALRALAIIASALLVVNAVEAALPHAFPGWMRIEMVVIVVLMAVLLSMVVRRIRQPRAVNLR
jgi:isoprenylcysteine carboxyl methyltransferase (ICMT) family protein YpbQ